MVKMDANQDLPLVDKSAHKWEYKILKSSLHGPNVSASKDEEKLNQLGLQGWDLFQIETVVVPGFAIETRRSGYKDPEVFVVYYLRRELRSGGDKKAKLEPVR